MDRLKKIAFQIAIVGGLGVNLVHYFTQRTHHNRDYCQLPLQALYSNSEACQLLGGKPITVKNLDLSKIESNFFEAKVIIPVQGQKRGGYIYTMSKRPNKESKWNMQYAVMKITEGDHRWNVWIYPDEGVDSNTDLLPDDVQDSLK